MPLVTDPDLLHWLTTDEKPRPLPTTRPDDAAPVHTGEQPR
jgi:hypothetical protein